MFAVINVVIIRGSNFTGLTDFRPRNFHFELSTFHVSSIASANEDVLEYLN
jgi:hypothetical protein